MFNHRAWEEELLEYGFESLGMRHVALQGKVLRYEVLATSNFESTSVDLQIWFPPIFHLESLDTCEAALNEFFGEYFAAEEWDDNWEWVEDHSGIQAFDLQEGVERIPALVESENRLLTILGIDSE